MRWEKPLHSTEMLRRLKKSGPDFSRLRRRLHSPRKLISAWRVSTENKEKRRPFSMKCRSSRGCRPVPISRKRLGKNNPNISGSPEHQPYCHTSNARDLDSYLHNLYRCRQQEPRFLALFGMTVRNWDSGSVAIRLANRSNRLLARFRRASLARDQRRCFRNRRQYRKAQHLQIVLEPRDRSEPNRMHPE